MERYIDYERLHRYLTESDKWYKKQTNWACNCGVINIGMNGTCVCGGTRLVELHTCWECDRPLFGYANRRFCDRSCQWHYYKNHSVDKPY